MNIQNCPLSIEHSSLLDWREWMRKLSHPELSECHAKIRMYGIKSSHHHVDRLTDISAEFYIEKASRFEDLVVGLSKLGLQVAELQCELGKAKILSRIHEAINQNTALHI